MVGREALKEEFLPASASGGEHDSAFNHIEYVLNIYARWPGLH